MTGSRFFSQDYQNPKVFIALKYSRGIYKHIKRAFIHATINNCISKLAPFLGTEYNSDAVSNAKCFAVVSELAVNHLKILFDRESNSLEFFSQNLENLRNCLWKKYVKDVK